MKVLHSTLPLLLLGLLTGCATLGQLNVQNVNKALTDISCERLDNAKWYGDGQEQFCRQSFDGAAANSPINLPIVLPFSGAKGDPESAPYRERRLLRAYMLIEASALYGSRRFAMYSTSPANDANRLMGNIASALDALSELEEHHASQKLEENLVYTQKRSDALFRLASVVDSASRPTRSWFIGIFSSLAAGGSAADILSSAPTIIRNVSKDMVYLNAYRDSIWLIASYKDKYSPAPADGLYAFSSFDDEGYASIKKVFTGKLLEHCTALGIMAGRSNGEHSCGNLL